MAHRTSVVWDDVFTAYDFGPEHPMNPVRLDLTTRLARSLGVLDHVDLVHPDVASDELLATAHEPAYIEAVRAASADPAAADLNRGLGTDDDPAFRGMHEASARIVQGTVEVCRRVWEGEADHGVNYCGGLHHAMRSHASGFCIYNDIVVGIQWLLDHGVERVAYVDIDVHHGDGVERAFWNDPRVLTISLHESGRHLFPGTGWPGDVGGPDARGSVANVALPPGTVDASWLRAIDAVVPPLVRAFAPQVLVTQHGCDTHLEDPLAHLAITVDAQRRAHDELHTLAHEVCDGRWVALGGGGYELVDVVPRSWTHLTAIAAHVPVDVRTPVPDEWRSHVQELLGRPGPRRMGDLPEDRLPIWVQPWTMGHNPDHPLDRSVFGTRQAVFPLHGLDPWFE
ncbi:acetoin utilization protein AcuC [Nostocoides sp. Soil756]|jgi:acetoin utilization protein AcuC|uniref:acetoin utilization protein AcuC n=1 Tax=Nostocoides sp. Soil756 TaxID=1736399 RepID=UPI0006FBBCE8|nr:acetoin utilization protein AcuC [Tetrasphaera sp. Soil756]KRE60910.1 acetoin utilization protein AcuC [Tetrasphaera sp. Soil756]